MPRFAVAAELRCLPTEGDQAQPCLEFPSKNVGTQPGSSNRLAPPARRARSCQTEHSQSIFMRTH